MHLPVPAASPPQPPHSALGSTPWPTRRSASTAPALSATRARAAEAADEARCLAELRTAVQVAAGSNFQAYESGPAFEADTGVTAAAFLALQDKLGHAWTHPWLLRCALVHVSYKAETTPTGTQPLLAWVGDSVLASVVTDELVVRYACSGTRPPTQLTVTRSLVLSRAGCARHARVLGLDGTGDEKLLVVGSSFSAIGSNLSVGMLGECFEAVLGSLYIDGGRAAARAAFLRLLPFPPALAEVAELYGAGAPSRGT